MIKLFREGERKLFFLFRVTLCGVRSRNHNNDNNNNNKFLDWHQGCFRPRLMAVSFQFYAY